MQLRLPGILPVIYRPTYLLFIGVSPKLPETETVPWPDVRHGLYSPYYACMVPSTDTCNVARIGKDRRGGGKAASGVGTRGYWQRPSTMALHSRETANSYNASHLANVFYSRLKAAPMLNKHHISKAWGIGGIAPCVLSLGNWLRWVVSFACRPLYHGRKSTLYPLEKRLGGLDTLNKIEIPRPRQESNHYSSVAQLVAYSLCRMSYPGSSILYDILYYTILYYSILYYTILYYTILYYTILYYTTLCYAMLCYAMLCYTIPYYTILYYTILYYTILYCTILYYTILYYTILYYAILYCTILCYIAVEKWELLMYLRVNVCRDKSINQHINFIKSLSLLTEQLFRIVIQLVSFYHTTRVRSLDCNLNLI
jgi:hypothetical protein